MLCIPTYLASSRIPGAGLGLFCREAVPKGTVIWRFDAGLDRVIEVLPSAPLARRFVEIYSYVPHEAPERWVLCVDDARFMNHADPPNTDDSGEDTVAARDIAAGEELTSDYRVFCRRPFELFARGGA